MDAFDGLDDGAYYFLRYLANQTPALVLLVGLGDYLGVLAPAVALFAAFLIFRSKGLRAASSILLWLAVGILVVVVATLLTQRARPADGQIYLSAHGFLEPAVQSSGFPSRAVLF